MFNIEAWNKLSPAMQAKHTFQNCKQCQLKYSHIQVLFPTKCKRFTGLMKENNPKVANKAIKVQLPSQPGSTTLREAALTKVKDLNIEKKSKAEKKTNNIIHSRCNWSYIYNTQPGCFGNRQSLAGRQRLTMCFETRRFQIKNQTGELAQNVPRKSDLCTVYEKLVLKEDGSIEKSSFFVEGCKCPLVEIRTRKRHELEKYMRINDEKDMDSMSVTEVENRLTMPNERKEEHGIYCEYEGITGKKQDKMRFFHGSTTVLNPSMTLGSTSKIYFVQLLLDTLVQIHEVSYRVFPEANVNTKVLRLISGRSANTEEQEQDLRFLISSNFKKEEAYLKHCWETYLKKKIEMPVKEREGGDDVVGCDDIVQTGELAVDVEYNVRDKGTCTNICIVLLSTNSRDNMKQTKQGQKLGYILGLTEDVLQFDKARKDLRASPQNMELMNKYLDVLPVMETKLLHEQTSI
ncbi:Hypothetical predicted protein [Paramuricea clavata]|uniref:Uncharacterized protein n=1 Tax=Paramuricea clavata TaxID=317549 RepID=A0A6S7I5W9_PARCT|nr:Hypothetical predicted protein [Paramuricea clavata]